MGNGGQEPASAGGKSAHVTGGAYAWYVLALMTLASAFSLLDRQVITILQGEIKSDLGLNDSELGFLIGTTFAVFYALFGVPLGRLADSWVRTRMLSIALAGWSVLTMLSGVAGNFLQLALTRAGVGIGEASANPTAFSLLSDYFPRERRATALAIYSCGIPLGLGASLMIGGVVVDWWNGLYPDGNTPFGLKTWNMAFLVVGAPGLLLALLVAFLREPPRGIADGVIQPPDPAPFRKTWNEFMAVTPLLSLVHLAALRARTRQFLFNIGLLGAIAAAVIGLNDLIVSIMPADKVRVLADLGWGRITSHTVQWATVGLGVFAIISWVQSLRLRDRPTYVMVWKTPTFVALTAVVALNLIINYGVMNWTAFWAHQHFHRPLGEVGLRFGAVAAAAGLIGTALGGLLSDTMRRSSLYGRLMVTFVALVVPVPLAFAVFHAPTINSFYVLFSVFAIITTMWLPGLISTCQDLVLPRMRGAAAAAYGLASSMIGLGLGPYFVGAVSDYTGDLTTGILSVYAVAPLMWLVMAAALWRLKHDEATRIERARAAGEAL